MNMLLAFIPNKKCNGSNLCQTAAVPEKQSVPL